mmetsp:Transcript_569/g.717  ORF Transcript_569/g.717 Transcript_569/m.717 type:complete len:99 (+) Transcript_569:1541-1837(+)
MSFGKRTVVAATWFKKDIRMEAQKAWRDEVFIFVSLSRDGERLHLFLMRLNSEGQRMDLKSKLRLRCFVFHSLWILRCEEQFVVKCASCKAWKSIGKE